MASVALSEDTRFLILCGTYERLLLGWEISCDSEEKWKSQLVIAYSPHLHSITAIAVGPGGRLLTGSRDEVIRVYDVARRKETGSLHAHEGTITAFDFFQKSHVFSAGEDGVVSMYRTRDWECLFQFETQRSKHKRTAADPSTRGSSRRSTADADSSQTASATAGGKTSMKSPKNQARKQPSVYDMPASGVELNVPVVSIAVHHTGKLMLSLSQDRTLRLWDLTRAKAAYTTKLALPGCGGSGTGESQCQSMRKNGMMPLKLKWNATGDHYAVLYEHALEWYPLQPADSSPGPRRWLLTQPRKQRFHCMALYRQWIVCGCEDGRIRVFSTATEPAQSPSSALDGVIPSSTASSSDVIQLEAEVYQTDCMQWPAHKKRVKDVSVVESRRLGALLVSIDSDGVVQWWDLAGWPRVRRCGIIESGYRLTACTVHVPEVDSQQRQQQPEKENEPVTPIPSALEGDNVPQTTAEHSKEPARKRRAKNRSPAC